MRVRGTAYTAVSSGSWSAPSTWSPAAPEGGPGAGDQVTIASGITVTWTGDGSGTLSHSGSLTVNGTLVAAGSLDLTGGSLSFGYGGSLSVQSDLTVPGNLSTNGTVSVGGNCSIGGSLSVAYQQQFSVGGNLTTGGKVTNNGSMEISGGCTVQSGGITNKYNCTFTVGGSLSSVGDVTNSGTFTVDEGCTVSGGGISNDYGKSFSVGGSLVSEETITNDGTFKVTGNCTVTDGGITNSYSQSIDIGSDLSVSEGLDNAGTVTVEGDFELNGDLDISYGQEVIVNGDFYQDGDVSSSGDLVVNGDYHYTSGTTTITSSGDIYVLGDLDGSTAGCDENCFPESSCPTCEISGRDSWEDDGSPGEEYVDSAAPVFSDCPSAISTSTGTESGVSLCSANVSWTVPTVTDDHDSAPSVTVNGDSEGNSYVPGYSFPVGTTTVTYTSTDKSGNSSECSFTVTVSDTVSPVIECPGDITVNGFAGIPAARTVSGFTTAELYDNCALDGSSFSSSDSYSAGSSAIVLSRSYTVSDQSGNTGTCAQQITIEGVSVTISSEDPTVCGSREISISSAVTGFDNPSCRWEKSTDGGENWTSVTGATVETLAVEPGTATAGDRYRLYVSNGITGQESRSNELELEQDSMAPQFPVDAGKYSSFRVCSETLPVVIDTLVRVTDVIDNCTLDFADLTVSYTITAPDGTETSAGGVPVATLNSESFSEGTSTVVVSFTDVTGNRSSDYTFNVSAGQSLPSVSIRYSTPAGGTGTGDQPFQCQEYIYYTETEPETGCSYRWQVYSGTTAGGTMLQTGTDYQLTNRNDPDEPSRVQITWEGTLVPGAYTVEVIKTSAGGCEAEATLTVELQNSFNLSVDDPGKDCKGKSVGMKIIEWEIDKECGAGTYSFSYTIVEGSYDSQSSVPSEVWEAGTTYRMTDGSSSPYSIPQIVNYGDRGDFYTSQVFTLFIYDITDGNGQSDTDESDNHQKFYLFGIPEISFIRTD